MACGILQHRQYTGVQYYFCTVTLLYSKAILYTGKGKNRYSVTLELYRTSTGQYVQVYEYEWRYIPVLVLSTVLDSMSDQGEDDAAVLEGGEDAAAAKVAKNAGPSVQRTFSLKVCVTLPPGETGVAVAPEDGDGQGDDTAADDGSGSVMAAAAAAAAAENERERELLVFAERHRRYFGGSLVEPYFRVSLPFLEGSHADPSEHTTDGIIEGSAGWEALDVHGNEEDHVTDVAATAPNAVELANEAADMATLMEERARMREENAGDGGGGNDEADLQVPAVPLSFRWVREWDNVKVDEEFARRLHYQPFVNITMADRTKFVPEKKEGVNDGNSDNTDEEAEHERNFLRLFPIDASALLDGDLSVTRTWMAEAAGNADGNLPMAPNGLWGVSITLSINDVMLNKEMRKTLNPMSVTLQKVRNLPGLILENPDNPRIRCFMEPTPFSLMQEYCKPVSVSFRLFDDLVGCERVVCTEAMQQQVSDTERINRSSKYQHKTVFLASCFDKDTLEEHLKNTPLVVEVHDRDVMSCKAEFLQRMKWERMLVEPQNKGGRGDDDDDDVEDGNGDKPLGPFAVDALALADVHAGIKAAGETNTYGSANFRLSDLLNTATDLANCFRRNYIRPGSGVKNIDPTIKERLRSDVVPRKRRAPLSTEEEQEEWDLTDCERIVRKPGQYLQIGTEVQILATIAGPLRNARERFEDTEAVGGILPEPAKLGNSVTASQYLGDVTEMGTLRLAGMNRHDSDRVHGRRAKASLIFERAVFCFHYSDESLLNDVQGVIFETNKSALPGISLRSYQLSDQEMESAKNGSLDIITGFSVLDDDFRIIVCEGLAHGGMARMHEQVKRRDRNNDSCRIFMDAAIRFDARLYTEFHVDLKRIKLRNPLPEIMKRPDIYDRNLVSQECFDSLAKLNDLRNANRLRHIKMQDGFPTSNMLLRLESKYGEAISIEDMEGTTAARAKGKKTKTVAFDDEIPDQETMDGKTVGTKTTASTAVHHHEKIKRKADTDDKNPEYEKYLRNIPDPVDHLAEQKKTIALANQQWQERKAKEHKELEMYPETGGQVYIYSGQKRQYTEWQKEHMRRKLAKDKGATYTYSENFNSLTMCMVNEEEIEKQAAIDSKKKWTTQGGFTYPVAKDLEELARSRVPKDVDEARKEDLRAPWIENQYHPQPLQRGGGALDGKDEFDCIPSNGGMIFGGYAADGTKDDATWLRSVHLVGDEVAAAEEARIKAEKEEWRSKIVVDNLSFMPHRTSTLASQVDKMEDILDGKAKKRGIKIVRKVTLPSGKVAKLKANPVKTIFADDEYTDPVDFTTTLKPNDMEHFYGTNEQGQTVPFHLSIHAGTVRQTCLLKPTFLSDV